MNESEEELFRMIQSSDPQTVALAVRRLYDRHVNALYSTAYRFLKEKHLALDLVHDLFVEILEKKYKLMGVQDFKLYYKTSVKNLVLKYMKRMAKRRSVEQEFLKAHELSEAISRQIDGRLEQLLGAIENLAPQQKKVYELKLEGMSQEEIRTETNLSINTIKHYTARAKELIVWVLKGGKP